MAPRRVLVVDDNPLNLELARFVLEADGMAVDVAADAEQARVLIQSFQPELVLMDIQMPGMDGLELTKLLKADPATREVRVVAFTAFAMKGDEQKLLAAGCDGYLAKPVDVATMAARVRSWLPPQRT